MNSRQHPANPEFTPGEPLGEPFPIPEDLERPTNELIGNILILFAERVSPKARPSENRTFAVVSEQNYDGHRYFTFKIANSPAGKFSNKPVSWEIGLRAENVGYSSETGKIVEDPEEVRGVLYRIDLGNKSVSLTKSEGSEQESTFIISPKGFHVIDPEGKIKPKSEENDCIEDLETYIEELAHAIKGVEGGFMFITPTEERTRVDGSAVPGIDWNYLFDGIEDNDPGLNDQTGAA